MACIANITIQSKTKYPTIRAMFSKVALARCVLLTPYCLSAHNSM